MERLSTCEKLRVSKHRKTLGTECGVLDQGIYYLVAIVLKDIREGGYIVINKRKRDFLGNMERASNGNTLYRYLLQKIIENACSLTKWRKWVRAFVTEYQKQVDIIIGDELKCADAILEYYVELLTGIQGIDEEEEYTNIDELKGLFTIQEMIDAVKRVCSMMDVNSEQDYYPTEEDEIGCTE